MYTSVLTQDIAELERSRQGRSEALHKITGDYISRSSRVQVTKYCESNLGMIQAHDGTIERFAVENDPRSPRQPAEFAHEFSGDNDLYRFSLLRESGKSGR